MPYTAEISRTNPMCFLFLVDQSGSMQQPFGCQPHKRKMDGVADALNKLMFTLVMRCTKGEEILDRYYVGLLGYGQQVGSAFGGPLAGQTVVPVSEIGTKPLRVETRTKKIDDGAGGILEQSVRFPVWFEPKGDGKTPMCEALRMTRATVEDFVRSCPNCFPPIIINITDGQATDGDPEPEAAELRAICSNDGNSLFFNLHISEVETPPIAFPSQNRVPPDPYAQMLYRMSSELPAAMLQQARSLEVCITEGARGFVFNADLVAVVQFLDIGTRVRSGGVGMSEA